MKASILLAIAAAAFASDALPVRGIHLMAPRQNEIPAAVAFIRETLAKEGVNLLVLEFDYHYRFAKRPEVAEPDSLTKEQVGQLAGACRAAGIRLIPQINLLGHQSWSKNTAALLRAHPEFDETPGKYEGNVGIYCRSYCPLHPTVHDVVFDLVDEIVDACGADAFHAGMDEVFLIGEDDCPRCKGKDKAELFAREVQAIRDHLAKSRRTLWIWGDRLLDGAVTGNGKWEASQNQTNGAMRLVPKDVVVCDWHYEKAMPTAAQFALEGLQVVSCPWRKTDVAMGQLELMRSVRAHANQAVAGRMLGMLQTTWTGMGPFMRAYNGEGGNAQADQAAKCFRELFRAMRGE